MKQKLCVLPPFMVALHVAWRVTDQVKLDEEESGLVLHSGNNIWSIYPIRRTRLT